MSELFTAGDIAASVGSDPGSTGASSESPSLEQSASATSAPTATESEATTPTPQTPGAPVPPRGPIPYDRHEAILAKARAEAQEKLKPYEGMTPQDIQTYRKLRELSQSDPIKYLQFYEQQVANHPAYRQQYAAWRQSQAPQPPPSQAQAQQRPEQKPQPDLITEDGKRVYSAEQAERAYQWELRQALAPILQTVQQQQQYLQQQQQAQQFQQMQVQATQAATSILAEASRDLPYFDAHRAEIKAAMEADGRLSLEGAWRRVVVPKLSELERTKALNDIKGKPGAGSINPTRGLAQSPDSKPPKDFQEGFAQALAGMRR